MKMNIPETITLEAISSILQLHLTISIRMLLMYMRPNVGQRILLSSLITVLVVTLFSQVMAQQSSNQNVTPTSTTHVPVPNLTTQKATPRSTIQIAATSSTTQNAVPNLTTQKATTGSTTQNAVPNLTTQKATTGSTTQNVNCTLGSTDSAN